MHNMCVRNVTALSAQAPAPEDITADMIFNDPHLFEDLWKDAEMYKVIRYLRGGVGLMLPEEWLAHMPQVPIKLPKRT